MNHPKLQLLQPLHAPAFRNLRLKSFKESPYSFSESYEDEKMKSLKAFENELTIEGDPPEQFVLGAFQQNELIGFVKFRRDKRSKARHKSMIHAMYVDPEFRNLGLGGKIIKELIARVKKLKGLEQIHLWVLHSGHELSAVDFYRRFGFQSQGTRVRKDLKIGEDYIDVEYMVLYFSA